MRNPKNRRRHALAAACLAVAWLLVAGLASAQAFLDNETLQYSNGTTNSNQDPNNETRRSDHFRLNFGHYNRDTGTPMTEELAQGNLQMFEQMRNRWVTEMGLHDINESSNPTYVDGNKYRTNFNFLMTWNDGGGGGAYSSSDNKGFFYAMANTSSCRFDPPSGATPHEMGHVWEGSSAGFNGSNSSGAWWECTANWMQLQFLNAYPQAGGYLYNSVFYPAHGRDYYDSWMIWEAAKEDPRYGAAWVNRVWTDATANQKINEYMIDRMIRLGPSDTADKAGAVKDLWGDMAKKMVTWDYARQRWLAQANTPWNGDTWEWYTRCRAPLVKLPGTTDWYRPAREHMPQQFGFHFVPLTATAGTTVSCNFKPLCDPVRQSDWRACLVAVNNAGQASYSPLWNTGNCSMTLSADQSQLYLMVIAVPKPMKIVEPAWKEYTRDSGLQFPYTVSFTNASPTNVIYPAQSLNGMVQHANGGGWKSTAATVDASAYVGPNAQVLDTAQVRGNARIEEYAVVRNGAQVRDNAVVSGHGMVYENAQVYGNAKVRDWAMLSGTAHLYENAKAIEHAACGGSNRVSGNVVMKGVTSVYNPSTFTGSLITDGDTANGNGSTLADHGVHFGWSWGLDPNRFSDLIDNNYQYSGLTFERDNAVFACDEYGINHGYLMEGCRVEKDTGSSVRGGRVLPLDGVSQYVELHNSINDVKDSTFAVWCKPSGGPADQRLWSLGDGNIKAMYLIPSYSGTGKPRFIITDGTTTQTLDSNTTIPSGMWQHVAVVFSGTTCTLYINGAAVASNPAMTLFPDSLNAPLMENANYLGRGNAGNYFQGSLDEFRMYNKALSAAEVIALWSTAAPSPITVTADTTPPSPNAATWLVAPISNGDNSATMSATPGTDASGWVEYYFACTSGGGHDSGWVSFNKYTDVGLTPGAVPTYSVKMRDRNGNATAVSSSASVTLATSTVGSAGFSFGPIGIANGQITMTATTDTNSSGKTEYKFDRTLPSAASSGWQSSPTWTQGGLTPGNGYSYTVTVRDGRGNTSSPSAAVAATASDTAGPALPFDAAQWQMQPYATIDNKICMTATPVVENGVLISYECTSGNGPDSGWLAATTSDDGGKSHFVKWTTPLAQADGIYSYNYRLKDAAGNISSYSTTYSAKITPTTGYHTYTLAQVLTGNDDDLVSFPATVLKVNSDNYEVKDLASGSSITVKPNTYALVTDPSLALKNVTVSGHLYTFAGVRVVTYATLTAVGVPTLNTISGRVTNASGAGIAGATVAFSDVAGASAHPIVTTTTDASGNYSRGVTPGSWYVAVTSSAHNTSADQSVTLGAANVLGVDFSLAANTLVMGTILRASDWTPLAGASVYFSRSPEALGSPVFTATTDTSGSYSQALQDGIWYVSAGASGYNVAADKTLSINGIAVGGVGFALTGETRNIPRTSDLLFSAITDNLPVSGATGPWPTYQPVGQTLTAMGSPIMTIGNSRKWISNLYADGDGFRQDYYPSAIPVNGATIIVAVQPARNTTYTSSTSIVNVFTDRLSLGIRNSSGRIDVYRNGAFNTNTTAIPSGQTTILSLVVQPSGTYKVFANGTQIMNVTAASAMTSLVPNGAYYDAINVGRNNPDAGTTFNGNIGDVFVYKVALSDADRQTLEADLSAKFAPSFYTLTASAGTGGYLNPTGAVSVNPGGSETFSIRPLAGQVIAGVTVDGVAQGVISSYTFDNVSANHTLSATFKAGTNSPPTISALGTQQVAANGNSGPLAFTIGDAETTAQNLTISAVSSNPAILPSSNMILGGSGANRTVTVTPAPSMIGSAIVTLTVSDGLASATSSFLLNVIPPAGAPSISAVADATVDEDHPSAVIPLTLADSDTPVTSLTLTGGSSNLSLVPTSNIIFSGSGAERSVVITPLPNQFGSAFITLTVSDGSTSVGIAFQLTVNPVNDTPTISNVADQSIAQDTATAAIPFVIGDLETNSASLTVTASSSNPAMAPVANIVFGGSGSNRTFVITPVVGKAGKATITLTVDDGSTTASDTFVLSVNPVVSAPSISINVGANGSLATTDAAGVTPVTYWNNLLGVNDPSAVSGSLMDRSGVAVAGLAASFQGGQNTFNAGFSPDTNLLSGFLNGSTVSATLTGVPYPTYDVYVYYNGFPTNHSLTWRLSNVTGAPVVLSTQYSVRGSASSGNAFSANGDSHVLSQYSTLAAANAAAAAGTGGTYLKFGGLTAAKIKIEELSSVAENGFTGIQIVDASTGTAPVVSDVVDLTIDENTATSPLPFTVTDAETTASALILTLSSSNTSLVPNANIVLGGSGSNRTVAVTPASNRGGSTVITLAVSDGTFTTVESFTLFVLAANYPPTITALAEQSTNEDTATAAIPFTIGDDTTSAAALVVTAEASDTTLVPNVNIVLGGGGADRTVTVTPASNQSGSTTVTLNVSDGASSASRSFVLTVNPVNDLPTISAVADQLLPVNTATSALLFTVGDVETPPAALVVTGTSSNQSFVPNANIAIVGSGANRTVTVTPAANQYGTALISLHVTDGTAIIDGSFTVVVIPPNTPPTISTVADQTVNEDMPSAALAFTIGDAYTSAQLLSLTASSANLSLVPLSNIVFGGSGANRTVTVTPALNQSGSATIILTVSDGSLTASTPFLFSVSAVNDVPTISAMADQSVAVDTELTAIPFTVGDVETPAAALVVTGNSSNQTLVPNANVVIGGSAENRTVTVTPASGQTGTATITLSVSDGTLTASETFDLRVSTSLVVMPYTWALAGSATQHSWLTPANWTASNGFPNATNHTATLSTTGGDIVVALNAPITIGGISSATGTLNISNGAGGGSLTFDNGNGLVDTVNFNAALKYRLYLSAGMVLNDHLDLTYSSTNNSSGPYIQGVVSGAGGLTVNYGSSATLALGAVAGAANTHQGGTTLIGLTSARTISAAKTNVVGAGPLSLDRVSLQLATFGQTFAGLNGGTNSSALTASGSPTITLNGSGSYAYSGAISGGISLVKSGLGTQVVSGVNTYTGATNITGGSLLVNGSLAAGSAVSVGTDGTLGGTGTVSGSVNNQGTLAPGASVGTLNTGVVVMAAGSKFQLEVADWVGTTPGTHWDLLSCGSLALAGTPANKIVIKVLPLSLTNFTETSKNFTIATSTAAISAFVASDMFTIDKSTMPGTGTWSVQLGNAGKELQLVYSAGSALTPFASWADTMHLTASNNAPGLDPDSDGTTNLAEFAFNSDPLGGASRGMLVTKFTTVSGTPSVFTLTVAVRSGASFAQVGNNQQAVVAVDSLTYVIEAANTFADWGTPVVTEVTGADAVNIQNSLPAPDSGWTYKTFRTTGTPKAFLRVKITSP
jgi:autotransporter-associated beta strand protein